MRESILGRLIRSLRFPNKERGVWNSQGEGKNKRFFHSLHKTLFSLSPELMITQQTIQFKLYTKNYIATIFPA